MEHENGNNLKKVFESYSDLENPKPLCAGKLKLILDAMTNDAIMHTLMKTCQLGVKKPSDTYNPLPLCTMVCKGHTDLVRTIFNRLDNRSDWVKLLLSCCRMPVHMANSMYWGREETVKTTLGFLSPQQQLDILSAWEKSEFTKVEHKVSGRGYDEALRFVRLGKKLAQSAINRKRAEGISKVVMCHGTIGAQTKTNLFLKLLIYGLTMFVNEL